MPPREPKPMSSPLWEEAAAAETTHVEDDAAAAAREERWLNPISACLA